VGGVGRGIKVKELAQDGTRAGTGVLGQRQGANLGEQRAVTVIRHDQGSLLRGSDFWSLGGSGILTGDKALVGALAQVPEHHGHDQGGDEQEREEIFLVAGNHGQ
jgi:hypothetical protein